MAQRQQSRRVAVLPGQEASLEAPRSAGTGPTLGSASRSLCNPWRALNPGLSCTTCQAKAVMMPGWPHCMAVRFKPAQSIKFYEKTAAAPHNTAKPRGHVHGGFREFTDNVL